MKFLVALLLSILPLSHSCKKETAYLYLTDMFPYMMKSSEVHEISFGADELSDRKYLIEGWESLNLDEETQKAFRLTKGSVSSLQFHLTSLSDIKILFQCEPSEQAKKAFQTAKVSVNGKHLQEVKISEEKSSGFNIPSALLNHGTNFITFHWQIQNIPVFFYSLKIQRPHGYPRLQAEDNITITSSREAPVFQVPKGAILEYYINLPKDPVLKFGLSRENAIPGNSIVHIAVYNERGEKITNSYMIEQSKKPQNHEIKLKEFERETVKIVFSNDITSDPNTSVSWIDPIVFSSSQKNALTIWNTENLETARSSSKRHKKELSCDSPNVFIYLVDTLRADHLECYNYRRSTSPYLNKFSKESLLFNNCFANASWTRPGVASILTGLYPNKHHGEREREKVSGEAKFLSEILRSNGYNTIYLTSNRTVSAAFNFNQGNDHYKLVEEKYRNQFFSSEVINSEFFKLIEDNPHLTEKPLFAFLHTLDPHDPYTPKAPFLKFVTPDKERQNLRHVKNARKKKWAGTLNQKDLDYMMSLYDCEILHNDDSFGRFIEFLKSNNLYESSMIIFISDHGEQFHEHGTFRHGYSIYNEEIHIPLLIKFPDKEYRGLTSEIFVSQVDILPTVLDYLGIDIPLEVDGLSILKLLERKDIKRTIFIKEYNFRRNFVGFISPSEQTKHIIRYQFPNFDEILSYEKFNLKNDFNEIENLFVSDSTFFMPSIKFQADYLLSLINRTSMKKEKDVDLETLDPKTREALKALGYLK